ncbi:hypothetical protein PIB30_032271 [Stylosanthes scabra]|uniref:Uncharacterized protein n=1 Tax=Stylosanthes scabra TaxID=79078 RepID=A0ABU6XAM5_9FABA|nr:hypothetical protein [Stylosanthes scabra]
MGGVFLLGDSSSDLGHIGDHRDAQYLGMAKTPSGGRYPRVITRRGRGRGRGAGTRLLNGAGAWVEVPALQNHEALSPTPQSSPSNQNHRRLSHHHRFTIFFSSPVFSYAASVETHDPALPRPHPPPRELDPPSETVTTIAKLFLSSPVFPSLLVSVANCKCGEAASRPSTVHTPSSLRLPLAPATSQRR